LFGIIDWISDLGVVVIKILVIHCFYVLVTAGWKIQILCDIFYFKIMLAITIKRMSALFVFSLWSRRNIDKTHLRRIVFSMFLSNLIVKSHITKKDIE